MAVASTDGRHDDSLGARLDAEPHRFDLRQAVRLLELMASGEIVPLGVGNDPRREALSLISSLSSSFPASDIESLKRNGDDRPPALTVTILGLAGAFGPLPPPLTAHVIERERVKDHSAREFLDLFNHRLLAILLLLDKLFAPALQINSLSELASTETPSGLPLLALLGLATMRSSEIEARLGDLAPSLIGAAGLLNQRPISSHAFERLICAHFDLPARVIPLRGGWLELASSQYTRLGRSGMLGRTSVLGCRVWDQAAAIRIEIGPIDREMLRQFLPAGARHQELARLAEFVLGDAFDIELALLLRPEAVPPAVLAPPRPQLGYTSWLSPRPRDRPAIVKLRLNSGDSLGQP